MYKDPILDNKCHVSFCIYDFESSPEEITKQLGLYPSETILKGELQRIGKDKHSIGRKNKQNGWILSSELPLNSSVEDHLENLINKLKPYKEKIKEITSQYYSEFSCAPYYHETNPGFQLSNSILKEISDLGSVLDFDVYCLAGTSSQFQNEDAQKLLEEQFAKVSFITKLTNEEPELLASSLIGIDQTIQLLKMHMEDLVIWEDLNEDLYKEKIDKISKDLESIIRLTKRSYSLNNI